MSTPTLLVAAPASGSGKTVLTLGILRALRRRGLKVGSFKVGPDYIDPVFHERASGRPCYNLDSWAMRFETLAGLLHRAGEGADVVVGEGVMGLFDGAPDGRGSTADLAALFNIPVVLAIEAHRLGQSGAAIAEGFLRFRDDVEIVALVFNRVASEAHAALLIEACDDRFSTPILGCLPRDDRLVLPERHLGLVQAREHPELDRMMEAAADLVERHLDLQRLLRLARVPSVTPLSDVVHPLPPLGPRIAVACDEAFAFAYPSVLEGWRARGAELRFFSPLNDEPPPEAEAVFLPGGYPELHAARLASCQRFLAGLQEAAARGFVYGECGGYMVLGQALIDRDGRAHRMAGLLPVTTSFAAPRLHLGYRQLELAEACPLGGAGEVYFGHEFHFAREVERSGPPLFARVRDARGRSLGPAGARAPGAAGSFIHLVDRAPRF